MTIYRQEAFGDQHRRSCSKKSVQQGHSYFCARSVLALREHGKMARTPLAAFFNRPPKGVQIFQRSIKRFDPVEGYTRLALLKTV